MKIKVKPISQGLMGMLCILVILMLTSVIAFGQGYQDIIDKSKTLNFKRIVKTIEEYYKDKDKGKGSGYVQFKRWEEFNKYHLDENGDIQNSSQRNFAAIYQYNLKRNRKGLRVANFPGNWHAMGPASSVNAGGSGGGMGRVNCIAVDPSNSSIIYAGTPAGGLWRSSVGGNSWTSLTDGISSLGISGIVIDPASSANNRTLFILTGDGDNRDTYSVGVMRSIDNGATWQSTALTWTTSSYKTGFKLVMDPTNYQIMMAATTDGIYRTTNGWISWSKVSTEKTYDIEYNPSNPSIVYAGGYGKFLRSTDGGASWTQITSGVPSSGRLAIAVSPNNSNYVYILRGIAPISSQFGGLYRSGDAGINFSLRSNAPNILGEDPNGWGTASETQLMYDLAIAVSPTNAEEVHTGGINCWKSTNGGSSWNITSYWQDGTMGSGNYTHGDIHALDFFGSTIYCGSDGGVSKSTNNANDWENLWTGLQIGQVYRLSVDATNHDKFVCGLQDLGSHRFENGTFYNERGGDGMDCAIDPTNTNTFYTSHQKGVFSRTTDNGVSFIYIGPNVGEGNWTTPFSISPTVSSTLFVAYADVWKSTNQGITWTNISNGNIGTANADHMEISPANPNVIFVAKENKLYKTGDGGASWSLINGTPPHTLPNYSISRIIAEPFNADMVCVSYGSYSSGNKVYASLDGGIVWSNISGTLPNIPINCLAFKNSGNTYGNTLFAGTDVGVFYYEPDAADWVPFNNGLPNVIVRDLEIRANRLYAGTYGRGIWRTEIDDCPNSIPISTNHLSSENFEADGTITSSAVVTNNCIVKYKAGTEITLLNGFSISSNATTSFKASIGPCGSAFRVQSVAEPLSGIYTGPMEGVNANLALGAYTGPMEGVAMAQPEEIDEELIAKTLILFPHPTANITTIEYYVANEGKVSISIADAYGKKIKNLFTGTPHKKGRYTTTFDASNLTKGVYVCTLTAGHKVRSLKMVVK